MHSCTLNVLLPILWLEYMKTSEEDRRIPGLITQGVFMVWAGDAGSIPGSGRSPGGQHGNPLQYSCPENPMD